MAKSKILKELANNEVSLEIALSRLMIIASDIDDDELKKWADSELRGYGDNSILPSYRVLGIAPLMYSGIQNRGFGGTLAIKGATLPASALPKDIFDNLRNRSVYNDIKTIQQIVENKECTGTDLSFCADIIYKATGIECTKLVMPIDVTRYAFIVSEVRTKLLTVFIELDRRLGVNADVRCPAVDGISAA